MSVSMNVVNVATQGMTKQGLRSLIETLHGNLQRVAGERDYLRAQLFHVVRERDALREQLRKASR